MSLRARNAFRHRLWGIVAALALGALLADAAVQAPDASAPPSTREVLRAMTKTLQAAERIRFRADIDFDDVLDDGQKVQFSGGLDVKIRRPDGLAADYRDDLSAKQLWYDGKTFTLFDPDFGVYATTAAPPALEPAMAQLERDQGVTLPLAALVLGNPYERVMEQALRGRYLGIHEVDGAACHHLAFVGKKTDFQIWVETGERPLPRKLVVTYKNDPESPQYVAYLSDWDLDAKLSDADFRSRVPDDAIATRFLAIREDR